VLCAGHPQAVEILPHLFSPKRKMVLHNLYTKQLKNTVHKSFASPLGYSLKSPYGKFGSACATCALLTLFFGNFDFAAAAARLFFIVSRKRTQS